MKLADEDNPSEKKKEKPAPPRVRIKASEEGAKIVASAKATQSRPAKAAESRPPQPAPKDDDELPPLSTGHSLAVAEVAPSPKTDEAEAAPSGKPPPPHIARGGKPAPPRRAVQAAPPVSTRPSPARSSEASPSAKVKVVAVAPEAAHDDHDHDHDLDPEGEGTEAKPGEPWAPHITPDAGRHSALTSAMGIVLLVFLVELGAGIASNSLALFSDAGHVFMDLFSYGVAFAAVTVSQRKSSERETFGGHRAEIVAAFISGVLLLIVVVVIYLEAFSRAFNPREGNVTFMLTVPLLSIAANLYLARRFEGAHDLNMRGARMHVLSDLMSGVGVLVGGVLILATGNWIFDPIVSGFIGLLILRGALELLRESSEILLERTPAHLKVTDLVARIVEVPGVSSVHAVHAWSLCSTVHALSAHVVSSASGAAETELLAAVRAKVQSSFGIQYTTIQVERESCGADQHPTVAHTAAEALSHKHSHA